MTFINEDIFDMRYNELNKLVSSIVSRWNEIEHILINDIGLSSDAAAMDRIMMVGKLKSLKSEKYKMIGRKPKDGFVAVSIPYDVPNFLSLQYGGYSILANMPTVFHFPSVAFKLRDIWQQEISRCGIDNLYIDDQFFNRKLNGKEFGEEVLRNNKFKHFILAGGNNLINHYSNIDKSNLHSLTLFGPTRPKMAVLSDIKDKIMIKSITEEAVFSSLFNNGQICSLVKELLGTNDNYELLKKFALIIFDNIYTDIKNNGEKSRFLSSFCEKAAFERGKEQIELLRDLDEVMILYGGKVIEEKKIIYPTLIEVKGDPPENFDGFWPYIIIRNGHNDDKLIDIIKNDKDHGCYVYIYTNDIQKYLYYEKDLLSEHFGYVIRNGTTMNRSIDQPYGGFKKTFRLFMKDQDGITRLKYGNWYMSSILLN